jgi:hypothetical protein
MVLECHLCQSGNNSERASGGKLHRSVAHLRDLAACASMDPDVFVPCLSGKVLYAATVAANSPAGTESCCLWKMTDSLVGREGIEPALPLAGPFRFES